jgi:hypothetical protein
MRLSVLRGQVVPGRLCAQTPRRSGVGCAFQLLLLPVSAAVHAAVGAFSGAEDLCGPGRGVGFGYGSRTEARAGALPARDFIDRLPHPGTLARVVVGAFCRQSVLEGGPIPPDAPGVHQDASLVVVPALPSRADRRPLGLAWIPGADHHPPGWEGVGYVRFAPVRAENAGSPVLGRVIELGHRNDASH